jgi:hypothetical protein
MKDLQDSEQHLSQPIYQYANDTNDITSFLPDFLSPYMNLTQRMTRVYWNFPVWRPIGGQHFVATRPAYVYVRSIVIVDEVMRNVAE